MKKRIVAFILALTALFGALILKAEALDISGAAAVLISADTGEVLYEKNADTRLPMASTTKIMTALVTLENADLGRHGHSLVRSGRDRRLVYLSLCRREDKRGVASLCSHA